jgi:hypothetical protein
VNKRRVLAVLAATVAAPYLPFLLAGLAWDLFVTPVASPVEYLGVLFVGTIGLLIYGIPPPWPAGCFWGRASERC